MVFRCNLWPMWYLVRGVLFSVLEAVVIAISHFRTLRARAQGQKRASRNSSRKVLAITHRLEGWWTTCSCLAGWLSGLDIGSARAIPPLVDGRPVRRSTSFGDPVRPIRSRHYPAGWSEVNATGGRLRGERIVGKVPACDGSELSRQIGRHPFQKPSAKISTAHAQRGPMAWVA